MRTCKAISVIVSLLLVLCTASACATTPGASAPTASTAATAQSAPTTEAPAPEAIDPFGKFEEPVEITTHRVLATWMGFDEGEDENNNWWSKIYLEKLNIKLTVAWTAPTFGEPVDQKIATCLATDDLPDLMTISNSWAMKLVKAGKCVDLTQTYDKYASPEVKGFMTDNNALALKNSTYEGKMFALGNPADLTWTSLLFWFRSDWLEKLNLKVPKTIEEVENVAKAFIAQDPDGNGAADTYGIALDNGLSSLNGVFYMYHGFPGIYNNGTWVDKGGKLEYSWLQPEIKMGLQKAAQWYKDGIFAKDFAIKTSENEVLADLVGGKVGIVMDAADSVPGGLAMAKKNDPDSDWIWIEVPSVDGKEVLTDRLSRCDGYNVVSYKCEHPEAVVKLINLACAIQGPDKPDYVTTNEFNTSKGGNMAFWNKVVMFGNPKANDVKFLAMEALKNNSDPSVLPLDAKTVYDQLKSWRDEGVKAENFEVNWAADKQYNYGGALVYTKTQSEQGKGYYFNPYWGPDTEAMTKNGSEWNSKLVELFTKAIMNDTVDQEFDAWVNYWKSNGGDESTADVNEWYAKNK